MYVSVDLRNYSTNEAMVVISTQGLRNDTAVNSVNFYEAKEDDAVGDDLHAFFDEVEHVAQQVNVDDDDVTAAEPAVPIDPTNTVNKQNFTNEKKFYSNFGSC
jgi:hypothetical protein